MLDAPATHDLASVRTLLSGRTFHVIPYAHADHAWTHYRQWHRERYAVVVGEVLDTMAADPTYTWTNDNVGHLLEPFLAYCPERVAEFVSRVREGRLEFTTGVVALVRPTVTPEETFIRNLVLGQEFLRSLIPGFKTDVYHSVDVAIGHHQLPQVLSLAGFRFYRGWRPQGAMDAKGFPRDFVWKGVDGTEITTSRGSYVGMYAVDYLLEGDLQDRWDEIVLAFYERELKNLVERNDARDLWLSFGMDDD